MTNTLEGFTTEYIVDQIGEMQERLGLYSEALKDRAEMEEGKKSVKIEGDKFVATITNKVGRTWPTKAKEKLYEILGKDYAMLLFPRKKEYKYASNKKAIDQFFDTRATDPKSQEAKKHLKDTVEPTDTRSLKLERLCGDDCPE